MDELKTSVMKNLDPQPEYFDDQVELFALLMIEHSRRNPNCENMIKSLLVYYDDVVKEQIELPKIF